MRKVPPFGGGVCGSIKKKAIRDRGKVGEGEKGKVKEG